MQQQRNTTLLKVISILFIIFGAISLIATLILAASLGALGAALGGAGLAGAMIFYVIIACLGGIIEFIAGIVGVGASNNPAKVPACKVWALIVLIISVISLIVGIISGASWWSSVVGIVLPILFFVGANQAS